MLRSVYNDFRGEETMQSRLHEFDTSYLRLNLSKLTVVNTFPKKEQRFFVRDCLAFIQQNVNAEQLQEKLGEWVADRTRRYGMPLNNEELMRFNETLAGLFPHQYLQVRK
jgi:homospermidine synthase